MCNLLYPFWCTLASGFVNIAVYKEYPPTKGFEIYIFSLNRPLGLFSLWDAMSIYVALVVPSVGDRNPKSWRLLVGECIATIERLQIFFVGLTNFYDFEIPLGSLVSVLVNQSTVHSGGVSRSVSVSRWQVTRDKWQLTHNTNIQTKVNKGANLSITSI